MKIRTAFRFAIIIQLIFFVLSIILSLSLDNSLPTELQEYLDWEYSQPISTADLLIIGFSIVMIGIQLISSIFLFFLRNKALLFYIASVVIYHLITLSIGPIVEHPYTYTAEIITALLSGFIIGVAFFNDSLFNSFTKMDNRIAAILRRVLKFVGIGALIFVAAFVYMFIQKRALPSDVDQYLRSNLVKDQKYNNYECTIPNWFGQIWISIDFKPDETFDSVIDRGLSKIKWTLSEIDKSKEYAAKKLLSLKNENWLHDNETAFTIDKFASQLNLESISIDDDNSFEINFSDGNLFFGHSVFVRVDANYEFYDAGIQG